MENVPIKQNKGIPKIQIKTRGCQEDFSKMPFESNHIFLKETGKCKICGKPMITWQEECIKRSANK